VAKTVKLDSSTKEKVFLNIVSSEKITKPSHETTKEGTNWQLPYSLGPPHMEKDKSGSNAPCFDCCFHPQAIQLGKSQKEFRDLLINTAIDGVEELYKRQKQEVSIFTFAVHGLQSNTTR
jgi:dynein assembly factor 2